MRVSIVTDQPWSGYNWYRRRPAVAGRHQHGPPASEPAELVHVVAHETYPGHHLEHAWKEADLVDGQGRLEASILLINTPECLISEGLADLGAAVRGAARRATSTCWSSCTSGPVWRSPRIPPRLATPPNGRSRSATHRRTLAAIRGNAAILRHADGRSHDEVLAYLRDVGRYAPAVAPRSGSSSSSIRSGGRTSSSTPRARRSCARWLDAVPEAERAARFGRLLHEQLTPAGAVTVVHGLKTHAVLAVAVVVGVGGRAVQPLRARAVVGPEAECRWNPTEIRLPGQVTAVDPADAARPHVRRRTARRGPVPSPRRRWFGLVATMWMYACVGSSGLMNPTRNPTSAPAASSAIHDVPVKCWNHRRGSSWCSCGRPTTRRPGRRGERWSASIGRRKVDRPGSPRAPPTRRSRPRSELERDEEPERSRRGSRAAQDAALGPREEPQPELAERDRDQGQPDRQRGPGVAAASRLPAPTLSADADGPASRPPRRRSSPADTARTPPRTVMAAAPAIADDQPRTRPARRRGATDRPRRGGGSAAR